MEAATLFPPPLLPLPRKFALAGACSALVLGLIPAATFAETPFQVSPAPVVLEGNFARAQLLVTGLEKAAVSERSADLTRQATYLSSNPQVAAVNNTGRLLAVGNGDATITVTMAGTARPVPVKVSGVVPEPKIGFAEHVLPILAKAGCNAGACHASQYGKGGFKLSVFGFAPEQDYEAIVHDGLGRRVNFMDPTQSLLFLKPTLKAPHEGGHRLEAGSVDHQILQRWLARGAPGPAADAPKVTGLKVLPERRVGPVGFTQQLQVLATYSNGQIRDVTAWSKFDSMDDGVLSVTRDGLVQGIGKGQGAAMARFEGQAEIARIIVPYADAVDLAGWVPNNFIDNLAAVKFKEVGIAPSPLCDDATFLRRAFLDVTGALPTVEQAAAFLDATDPKKRQKLIDQLLGLTGDPAQDIHNNEYASLWALKWSDLIRSNSVSLGEQGMWALHNWIKESFRENKPFDQFVRELITAKGSTYSNGPSNYFRIANNPQDLTEATAQLFLGIRLQCAKCHHHPYEKYSQADYYSFAAFFARVGSKTSQDFGIFGGESVIMIRSDGEVGHPRTGQVLPPTPLHGKPVPESLDRRQALATWLTARDNHYFARNVVNRYWAYLLGRGLVEPIDDMRATNPPSNVELMNALAEELVKSNFNLKHLLRTVMNSRLYQLDSQPSQANAADSRFYSHYHVKRLAAEPLLDAVDHATGVQTKFEKVPLGTRAIELPDAKYNNYFLTTFGKPRREGVCECERVSEPNLAQALHTLNGDTLAAKIAAPQGRIARLIAAKKSHEEMVQELYLATLCRRPTAEERASLQKFFAETKDAKVFYEDLLWSLLNSKQFLFVR